MAKVRAESDIRRSPGVCPGPAGPLGQDGARARSGHRHVEGDDQGAVRPEGAAWPSPRWRSCSASASSAPPMCSPTRSSSRSTRCSRRRSPGSISGRGRVGARRRSAAPGASRTSMHRRGRGRAGRGAGGGVRHRGTLASSSTATATTSAGGGPPTFGVSWVDDGPLRRSTGRPAARRCRRGRDGRRHRGRSTGSRSATGCGVLLSGPAQGVPRSSGCSASATAPTSARSPSPRSTSRPRSASSTPTARSTRSTCSATPRSATGVLQRAHRDARSGPATTCSTAGEATLRGRQAGAPVPRVLHRRAARVRRDRCGGRRVHHLQHVHDPRGAAHARARVAAGDGCDRRTGRAVGGARGLRRRRRWRRRSGWASGSCSGSGCSTLLRELGLDLPEDVDRRCSAARSWSRCVVGVLVTVVAAAIPAVRAARVPPVAAIADVPDRAVGAFAPAGGRSAWSSLVARGGGARVRPRPRRVRRARSLDQVAGGRARCLRRAGRRGDAAAPRSRARRCARSARRCARLGATGHARPCERDAQPAPHRDHRVGAGHRARARRAHRDVRRVGAGVGGARHRRGPAGRLRGEDRRLRRLLDRGRRTAARAARGQPSAAVRCDSPTARSTATSRPSAASSPDLLTDVVDLELLRGDAAGSTRRRARAPTSSRADAGVDVGDQLSCSSSRGLSPLTVRGIYRQPELHRHVRAVGAVASWRPRRSSLRRRRHAAGHARAGADRTAARLARDQRDMAGRCWPTTSPTSRCSPATSSATSSRRRSTSSSRC